MVRSLFAAPVGNWRFREVVETTKSYCESSFRNFLKMHSKIILGMFPEVLLKILLAVPARIVSVTSLESTLPEVPP